MTTKKRAKPEHLQKLTALFERYDSLNMKQVLTELQTSVVNAQAALDELGAVKQGAKWVLVDDESAPVEVAPGAKAEIEQSVEPPSNPAELPEPETVAVIEALDWENAPEGATHYSVITGAYYSYAGGLVHFKDGQWEKSGGCFQEMQRSVGVIVRPASTPES